MSSTLSSGVIHEVQLDQSSSDSAPDSGTEQSQGATPDASRGTLAANSKHQLDSSSLSSPVRPGGSSRRKSPDLVGASGARGAEDGSRQWPNDGPAASTLNASPRVLPRDQAPMQFRREALPPQMPIEGRNGEKLPKSSAEEREPRLGIADRPELDALSEGGDDLEVSVPSHQEHLTADGQRCVERSQALVARYTQYSSARVGLRSALLVYYSYLCTAFID